MSFDWYVDSVSGSDSNDGSEASPFATSAKVVSVLANGESIAFARGGTYDRLNLASFNTITVAANGEGALPIFRSDVEVDPSDWSLSAHGDAGGVVYEISWDHSITSVISRIGMWVDDVRPTRVASVALCAATPGTFYSPSDGSLPSNDPCTIYYHPTGSTNPTSDGKVVDITLVGQGITHGANCNISDVYGLRNAHDNGSIWTDENGSVWNRMFCDDGTKHNCLLPDTATDIICAATDDATAAESSLVPFTAYKPDPSASSGVYTRLGVHGLRSGTNPAADAFYAHGSPNDWVSISLDQCWSRKLGVATTGWWIVRGTSVSMTNHSICCCDRAFALQTDASVIRRMLIQDTKNVAASITKIGATATHDFRDIAAYMQNPTNTAEIQVIEGGHDVNVTECTFVSVGSGNVRQLYCENQTSNFDISKCIFAINGNSYPFWLDGATTYTSDFNIFLVASGAFRIRRTDISGFVQTLALHQSINSKDLNSVYAVGTDQTAGNANALWLGYTEAAGGTSLSTIGPAAGDFRINPSARVYKADGTAMVGTFADESTPITEAGQQTHWNPNTRTVVNTPATRWPVFPDSRSEILTYLNDPTAWDYYP